MESTPTDADADANNLVLKSTYIWSVESLVVFELLAIVTVRRLP